MYKLLLHQNLRAFLFSQCMPHVLPIAFSLFDQPNSIVERYISRFYRGLHLDQRLTWQAHVKAKRQQLNLRVKKILLAYRPNLPTVSGKQTAAV
jgi:hypothetical protein